MMDTESTSPRGDRELWARVSGSPPGVPGDCPALIDLAAYIDGRTSGRPGESIEAHLADCSECRTGVLEIRSLLDERVESTPLVPPAVIESARALVAAPQSGAAGPPPRRDTPWLWLARWSLSAAATIGICLVGYQVGLTTLDARGTSEVRLAAEMSFGVLGLNGDDSEFELLALAVEEVPR